MKRVWTVEHRLAGRSFALSLTACRNLALREKNGIQPRTRADISVTRATELDSALMSKDSSETIQTSKSLLNHSSLYTYVELERLTTMDASQNVIHWEDFSINIE